MESRQLERLKVFIEVCEDILYLVQFALAKGASVEARRQLVATNNYGRPEEGEYALRTGEQELWRNELETDLRIKEMKKLLLKTNDIFVLIGNTNGKGTRQLLINGMAPIKIDRREYLVLYLLALERSGGGGFLRVDDLIEKIIAINERANEEDGLIEERRMFWPYPSDSEIYTVVCRLRGKLEAYGHAGDLIENAVGESGYRLSTAAANIFLLRPAV